MNHNHGKFSSALSFILLIGFLFFFSGVPGTDDEQLFASAAQSYYITGDFSAYQVYGNARLQGYYAGIAPPHVWLALLAYWLAERLHSGGLQCFFLLSPFYSALTGYLLIQIAAKRGFSKQTILISIFIFGFATMVLTYSRSFFREPLAMLFLTASFYEIDSILHEKPNYLAHTGRMVAALLFLLLAIWTKEFLIVCAPLLAGYFFIKRKTLFSHSSKNDQSELVKTNKIYFVIIGCVLFLITIILLRDSRGRFSISYLSRLANYFSEMKHDVFWESLLRIFFSPTKGFLIYSPPFLLVLVLPLFKNYRAGNPDYLLALGSSVGVAILQAYFYDSEWWTFTWSTRFLLPITPLLIICILPCVEFISQSKSHWGRIALFLIILISVFVQLGSVLISSADYSQFLWEHYHYRLSETNISHIEAIPAVGHWLAFFNGVVSDVSWIRILQSGNNNGAYFPIGLMLAGAVVLALLIKTSKYLASTFGFILHFLCMALPFLTLVSNQDDPYYGKNLIAYQRSVKTLTRLSTKGDVIAIDAYNQPLWYYYFNFGFPKNGWISLPPPQASMFSNLAIYPEMDRTISFIFAKKQSLSKIWLVTEKKEKAGEISYLAVLKNSGLQLANDFVFFQNGQYPIVHVLELS